uniref:Uncharacterized protein n=1 Tax=Anguilla anguilla TaxID=7936 RepID=A0A0E9TJ27_ANGAN
MNCSSYRCNCIFRTVTCKRKQHIACCFNA